MNGFERWTFQFLHGRFVSDIFVSSPDEDHRINQNRSGVNF